MIVTFTDMSGDECGACLQNRVTTEKNPASHDDNSRSDLNTAVDRDHDTHRNPVEPARALEMDSADCREQEDSSTPQHDDDMAAHSSSHKIHNQQSSPGDAHDSALPKKVAKKKQSSSQKEKKPCSHPKCGKSFAPRYLPEHMAHAHGLEKPHRCDECSKSFFTALGLKKHKLRNRHKGEQSFICKICDKVFTIKYSLTRHTRIHNKQNSNNR